MNLLQELALLQTRRQFFGRLSTGIGTAALASLLNERAFAAETSASLGSLPAVHVPGKAKNVIFLFMSGGPSHIDLFDYKPQLQRLAGQPIPESFGMFKTRRAVAKNKLMPSHWTFRKRGESGMEISDALPNIASM